jgi:predicted transposase/invertase (TIGR01784 family)
MSKELLSVKNDYVFKRIFGDVNNTDILADFLGSVLDIPEGDYDHLEIVDPHLLKRFPEDKFGILDVRVHTVSGKHIDVEIQINELGGFRERIVYYSSSMVTGQMRRGGDYANIKRVISIIITDFKMIETNELYHHRFRLYDDKAGVQFTDTVEINTLELPKLPEKPDGRLWSWLKLMDTQEEDEMAELAKENPMIRKTVGVLKELSEDEAERMIAFSQEMARMDERARISFATEKGIAEGLAEGLAEGKAKGRAEGKAESKIEIARNLKAESFDAALIAKITGLSPEEIEKL